MDQKLEQQLIAKYPRIFARPMEWGILTGDGWYQILDDLCAELQALADQGQPHKQPVVEQIKEKFGRLRFYSSAVSQQQGSLIIEAEKRSAVTCETCSATGRMRSRGLMRVCCDAHAPAALDDDE